MNIRQANIWWRVTHLQRAIIVRLFGRGAVKHFKFGPDRHCFILLFAYVFAFIFVLCSPSLS
jgi:hypothetical protein